MEGRELRRRLLELIDAFDGRIDTFQWTYIYGHIRDGQYDLALHIFLSQLVVDRPAISQNETTELAALIEALEKLTGLTEAIEKPLATVVLRDLLKQLQESKEEEDTHAADGSAGS